MNKLSYIILDDDQAFCLWLEAKIRLNVPNFKLIASYHTTLEGILAISREKPDVLFLDMNIDGLNGIDVLELMKYEPATIIISSASKNALDFKDNTNIHAFLKKPFTVEELQSEAEKLTKKITSSAKGK
jgi:two-component system LytT family response regulator